MHSSTTLLSNHFIKEPVRPALRFDDPYRLSFGSVLFDVLLESQ